MNDMLPLLADGLRAVQKAEECFDATIGEDCQFECRKGLTPASNPVHRPSSNGVKYFAHKMPYLEYSI